MTKRSPARRGRRGKRDGHAPGHVRDAFYEAVEVFDHWNGIGPEPMVDFEVNFRPRKITISEACRKLWNCTDIMPSDLVDSLLEVGIKSRTYAAGARAMRRWIKNAQNERLAGVRASLKS
jgi:hypothetical protein